MSRTAAMLLPDFATKIGAQAVHRLYVDPQAALPLAQAARRRLEEMAARHGMNPTVFVIACGLRKPRPRVKAGPGAVAR
jgi:hypothetical protein